MNANNQIELAVYLQYIPITNIKITGCTSVNLLWIQLLATTVALSTVSLIGGEMFKMSAMFFTDLVSHTWIWGSVPLRDHLVISHASNSHLPTHPLNPREAVHLDGTQLDVLKWDLSLCPVKTHGTSICHRMQVSQNEMYSFSMHSVVYSLSCPSSVIFSPKDVSCLDFEVFKRAIKKHLPHLLQNILARKISLSIMSLFNIVSLSLKQI